MQPMEQEHIAVHNIIEKYLRGQLTPEETESFELYLMDNPALIEQLEIDDVLQRTLPDALQSVNAKTYKWYEFGGLFDNPLRASLATLMVCMFGFALLYHPEQLDQGGSNAQPGVMINIEHVYLSAVRGEGSKDSVPTILLKNQDIYFEITLQTNDDSAVGYEISIANRTTGETLLLPQKTEVNPQGEIKLTLPSKVYQPADYRVTALPTGKNSKPVPQVFEFSVRYR